jgi:hypothetical protein
MLIVAAMAAAVLIIASPALGIKIQHGIAHAIAPAFALIVLCVLLFSVIRGS